MIYIYIYIHIYTCIMYIYIYHIPKLYKFKNWEVTCFFVVDFLKVMTYTCYSQNWYHWKPHAR